MRTKLFDYQFYFPRLTPRFLKICVGCHVELSMDPCTTKVKSSGDFSVTSTQNLYCISKCKFCLALQAISGSARALLLVSQSFLENYSTLSLWCSFLSLCVHFWNTVAGGDISVCPGTHNPKMRCIHDSVITFATVLCDCSVSLWWFNTGIGSSAILVGGSSSCTAEVCQQQAKTSMNL